MGTTERIGKSGGGERAVVRMEWRGTLTFSVFDGVRDGKGDFWVGLDVSDAGYIGCHSCG